MAVKIAYYFPIFWQKLVFFIVNMKLIVTLGKRRCKCFQEWCHQPAPSYSFLSVLTRRGGRGRDGGRERESLTIGGASTWRVQGLLSMLKNAAERKKPLVIWLLCSLPWKHHRVIEFIRKKCSSEGRIRPNCHQFSGEEQLWGQLSHFSSSGGI